MARFTAMMGAKLGADVTTPTLNSDLEDPDAKVVAFYRRDVTARIVRLSIPALLSVLAGGIAVGWSLPRVEVADPAGLYAEADQAEARYGRPPANHTEELAQAKSPLLRPTRSQRRALAHQRRQAIRDGMVQRGESTELSATVWLMFLLGLLAVAGGPVILLTGLRKLWLRDEDIVVARTDGLIRYRDGERRHVLWHDVEKVTYDSEAGVVLRLRDGDELHLDSKFATGTPSDLAQDLEIIRRKAIFQLLPQQR